MYILYLDGSGSIKNPTERHFVLAGVAVFERQIFHLIKKCDEFAASLNLDDESHAVELHGSVMSAGSKSPWKGVVRQKRLQIIEDSMGLIANAHHTVKTFAVVVDKHAVADDDPVKYAYEEICNRFNKFLEQMWRNDRVKQQRGLIIMDKSHYEEALQILAREFREKGSRWGPFRNLAEVPLFVDSAASRLIQLADLLAWAVWRCYEHDDTRYFKVVVGRFHKEGGVIHGLVHRKQRQQECYCPACLSRAKSTSTGRAD